VEDKDSVVADNTAAVRVAASLIELWHTLLTLVRRVPQWHAAGPYKLAAQQVAPVACRLALAALRVPGMFEQDKEGGRRHDEGPLPSQQQGQQDSSAVVGDVVAVNLPHTIMLLIRLATNALMPDPDYCEALDTAAALQLSSEAQFNALESAPVREFSEVMLASCAHEVARRRRACGLAGAAASVAPSWILRYRLGQDASDMEALPYMTWQSNGCLVESTTMALSFMLVAPPHKCQVGSSSSSSTGMASSSNSTSCLWFVGDRAPSSGGDQQPSGGPPLLLSEIWDVLSVWMGVCGQAVQAAMLPATHSTRVADRRILVSRAVQFAANILSHVVVEHSLATHQAQLADDSSSSSSSQCRSQAVPGPEVGEAVILQLGAAVINVVSEGTEEEELEEAEDDYDSYESLQRTFAITATDLGAGHSHTHTHTHNKSCSSTRLSCNLPHLPLAHACLQLCCVMLHTLCAVPDIYN
jgi:hypothetical protein